MDTRVEEIAEKMYYSFIMEKKSIQLITFVSLFVLALIAFIITLFLYISVISRTPDVMEMEVQQADEKTALVSFLSGEAFVFRHGGWSEISIGDVLKEQDRIKVVDNSFCELQIGQFGIVAVESNTIVDLASVYSAAGESKVDLDILSGTLLCKVNKLTGNDAFEVRAQAAVIGVRGTHFLVASDGDTIIVAVSEGTVEFFSVDESFEKIMVPAKTEVVFVPSERTPAEVQSISDENAAVLSKVEARRFLSLEAQNLVPILIQTVPADAEILINGVTAGYGKVFAVYSDGEELDIKTLKSGYKDGSLQINVDAEKQNIHTLSLTVDDSVQFKQKEEADTGSSTKELEAEIEALKKELETSRSVHRELEGRIESLNKQLGNLESDKATLNAEVRNKEEEISTP